MKGAKMRDLKERLNLERTDFRFFNDLTIKINLNYVWWGHYDFFDKDTLLARIESSYRWDDILFRVLPNIFVVVVFISLAIRIVMFNFKDGIFEIFRG